MLEQTQYLAAADGRVTPDEQAVIDAMEALVKTVAALTAADAGTDSAAGFVAAGAGAGAAVDTASEDVARGRGARVVRLGAGGAEDDGCGAGEGLVAAE